MSVLTVKNLSKTYRYRSFQGVFRREKRETKALTDISFSLDAGQALGLVGPNGSGKTTLTKLASGMIHCETGVIRWRGEDPFLRSKTYRKHLGIFFGGKGRLDPDMSIDEQSVFQGIMYGMSREATHKQITKLAEMLALSSSQLQQQARTLSLGERAKGELVLALLHEPSILYMDEPCLGLDYGVSKRLRSFFRDYLLEHQASLLLTSHQMDDIVGVCDQLLILKKGACQYLGPLKALPSQLLTPCWIQFRSAHLETIQSKLQPLASVEKLGPQHWQLRCQEEHRDLILQMIYDAGAVSDLRLGQRSYEEMVEDVLGPCAT